MLVVTESPAGVGVSERVFTVMVDAGHGGELRKGVTDGSQESHGASHNNATAKGGVLEKDLALDYSRAIAGELRKIPGWHGVMTREEDRSVSALQRAALGVEERADVFLSIHFNAGGGQGPRAYVVAEDHAKWEYMHFVNPYIRRDAELARRLVVGLEEGFAKFGVKPSAEKVFNDTSNPTKDNGLGTGIRTIGYARMDTHLYNAAVVLLEVEFLDNAGTTAWLLWKGARRGAGCCGGSHRKDAERVEGRLEEV